MQNEKLIHIVESQKVEFKDIIKLINDYLLSSEDKINESEDPDKNLNDLKIDSILIIRLLVLVEEQFDIEFDIEEMIPDRLNTVRKITDTVNKRVT